MAARRFDFRGPASVRTPVKLLLDGSSAAIEIGDAITLSDASDGYVKEVDASGEAVLGIAMQKVASPASDGLAFVLTDISELSTYEVNPDAGTVTQALQGNSADCGANARSVNIDASATDDILITSVDLVANTMLVQIKHAAYTGVA